MMKMHTLFFFLHVENADTLQEGNASIIAIQRFWRFVWLCPCNFVFYISFLFQYISFKPNSREKDVLNRGDVLSSN